MYTSLKLHKILSNKYSSMHICVPFKARKAEITEYLYNKGSGNLPLQIKYPIQPAKDPVRKFER